MKYDTLFIKIVSLIIIALYAVKIGVEAKQSTGGGDYFALQNETKQIKVSNDLLNQDLLHHQSFSYIAQEARSMGFGETKTYIYMRESR